jgi:hypothetical protein
MTVLLIASLGGCKAKPRFAIGDCAMAPTGSKPEDIVRVVGNSDADYNIQPHASLMGKLVLRTEAYLKKPLAELNAYAKVECPAAQPVSEAQAADLREEETRLLIKVAKVNAATIMNAAQQIIMDSNGICPTGIAELVAKKALKDLPKDPWGHDFSLRCPGKKPDDGAEALSAGPDGKFDTADDVSSAE